MVTDTFLPLERRHTMRPSDVQVAVTLFSVLALLSNSLRRLVRFSVMRSFAYLTSLQTFRAGDIDQCPRIRSERRVCC